MTIQFTDDEIETIKSIICEHGSDYPGTDSNKVLELEYKLGLSVRPTAEEIAEQERKRKEFRESPFGIQMAELFKQSNQYANKIAEDIINTKAFYEGSQWPIESQLKIRLPKDYNIKKD